MIYLSLSLSHTHTHKPSSLTLTLTYTQPHPEPKTDLGTKTKPEYTLTEEGKALAVFVGGFSQQVTPQMLHELFSLCGHIKHIVVYEYSYSLSVFLLSILFHHFIITYIKYRSVKSQADRVALVIYSDPRFVSVAASLHGAVLGTSIISASKLSAEHVQRIEQDFQFKERLNPNADFDSEANAEEKKGQEEETEEAENSNDKMEEGKTRQEQVLIYMHGPLSYMYSSTFGPFSSDAHWRPVQH